jgi:hypothetical protein
MMFVDPDRTSSKAQGWRKRFGRFAPGARPGSLWLTYLVVGALGAAGIAFLVFVQPPRGHLDARPVRSTRLKQLNAHFPLLDRDVRDPSDYAERMSGFGRGIRHAEWLIWARRTGNFWPEAEWQLL